MLITRKNRINRIIFSTIIYCSIMLVIYLPGNLDTLSLYAVIILNIIYIPYLIHAVVETIKHYKNIPVITLTKDTIVFDKLLKNLVINIKDIKDVNLLQDNAKYTKGIKIIRIKYNHPPKYNQIYDLYQESIIDIFDEIKKRLHNENKI